MFKLIPFILAALFIAAISTSALACDVGCSPSEPSEPASGPVGDRVGDDVGGNGGGGGSSGGGGDAAD